MFRKKLSDRPFVFIFCALCVLSALASPFIASDADAAGGGCNWSAHTEIDYFDNPQTTGTPVGWKVLTCSCNIYSDGVSTPYFTIISETPCDPF